MMTDGELRAWLDTHYARITIHEACAQTREQAAPNLAVFVRGQQGWSQLDKSQVEDMWLAHTRSRSFCHFISRDLLKLSAAEYANVKRNLENVKSDGLAGIYKAKKSKAKPLEPYAVVLEFPESSALYRNLLIAGGSLLGAATVGGVFIKKSRDKKQATQPTLAQISENEDSIGVIRKNNLEITNLDEILKLKREELNGLELQIPQLRDQVQSIGVDIKSKTQRNLELDAQREAIENALTPLIETKSELNELLEEIKDRNEEKQVLLQSQEELLRILEELENKITFRQSFIESFAGDYKQKLGQRREIDQDVASLTDRKQRIENSIDQLRSQMESLDARSENKLSAEKQELDQIYDMLKISGVSDLEQLQDMYPAENFGLEYLMRTKTELDAFKKVAKDIASLDEMKRKVKVVDDIVEANGGGRLDTEYLVSYIVAQNRFMETYTDNERLAIMERPKTIQLIKTLIHDTLEFSSATPDTDIP